MRSTKSENPWKLPLVSAAVCSGVSLVMAGIRVALSGGFGAHDILAFFVWTVPLSIIIAVMQRYLAPIVQRRPRHLGYFVMAIIGAAAGGFWTYVAAVFFGTNFGAFSFQILSFWIVGAASGLIAGLNSSEVTTKSMLAKLAIIFAMCLAALVFHQPILRFLMGSQEVEVIAVKWAPGSEPLTNPAVAGLRLPEKDLERLKGIGLRGLIQYASSGSFGKGKRSRVIIVISQQLREAVALPQPDGGEVIYVQNENGWKMYPPNSETLKRNILLKADPNDPARVTAFYVDNADGSRQGGTLVTW